MSRLTNSMLDDGNLITANDPVGNQLEGFHGGDDAGNGASHPYSADSVQPNYGGGGDSYADIMHSDNTGPYVDSGGYGTWDPPALPSTFGADEDKCGCNEPACTCSANNVCGHPECKHNAAVPGESPAELFGEPKLVEGGGFYGHFFNSQSLGDPSGLAWRAWRYVLEALLIVIVIVLIVAVMYENEYVSSTACVTLIPLLIAEAVLDYGQDPSNGQASVCHAASLVIGIGGGIAAVAYSYSTKLASDPAAQSDAVTQE